ncbi:zinc finger protein 37 [Oryzias latipes]|uniref:zinc finger protein 37 n=1 Tax=Oryzias latipes TaxID=8090 RepID=UPI0005CC235E|nr:zinc finger protein 37 [Oryzias latipes]
MGTFDVATPLRFHTDSFRCCTQSCRVSAVRSFSQTAEMFYWKRSSGGGSEPLDSLGNMSKSDILRGIISEKLSTAARDILAVVERTVADYEEEASGFRRRIARQERQLELLQPEVKLRRRGAAPEQDLCGSEGVLVGEEPEEAVLTRQTDVDDTASLDIWYIEDDANEDDEEERVLVQPTASARMKREDLKDPDYEVPSRSIPPRLGTPKRRPGRPRTSDQQDHLDLRVRLLEDCGTEVLSNRVFRKYPVKDLRCPRGLQEAPFLDLLRSRFPQLASGAPFDLFVTDNSRRLRALQVPALTPEQIHRTIRSGGNSALYIRLRTPAAAQSGGSPPQNQEPESHPTSRFLSVPSGKRRRGRPRIGEEPTHHVLRICVLEDPQPDESPDSVLHRSPIQELKCPRGLQEAEFLDLLRSSFPRLRQDDRKLGVFKSDRSKRLQRLRVGALTPEEIYRSMKSTGIKKTLLYIKMKTSDEEESEEETKDEPLGSDSLQNPTVTDGHSSAPSGGAGTSAESPSTSSAPHTDGDFGGAMDQDLDWKPGPELVRRPPLSGSKKADRSRTPCKVCGVWYRILGSLIKHAWSHADEQPGVCGVCGENRETPEELKDHLKTHQTTHDCSHCGKSFLTLAGLNNHTSLHTGNRPFRCSDCSKSFVNLSSLSIHRWIHVVDKPYKCDVCPKSFGLKAQLTAHKKAHAGKDQYHCNICNKQVYDRRSLTRHKMTHSGERRFSCQVCGKRFKLPGTLKAHEKTHTVRDRPFLCHMCCKTFLSSCSLVAHMKTHSGERPFVCAVCSRGFLTNEALKKHLRVHTGEAPYDCKHCGRFFKLKSTLNSHIRSHLGIKRFTCGVCGKACSRQEHLTVHMRTHNGERPYKCSQCDKAFTQSHCLKSHMRSHHGGEDAQ